MSRLGMLYALTDEEVTALKNTPIDSRYDYALTHYETPYLYTPRAYEFHQAWEGLHYVFTDGEWIEDDIVPYNIVFGGRDYLLETDEAVLLLKPHDSLEEIVNYLKAIDLKALIKEKVPKLSEEALDMPLDEDFMAYLYNWGHELLDFYRFAQENGYHVLFIVQL